MLRSGTSHAERSGLEAQHASIHPTGTVQYTSTPPLCRPRPLLPPSTSARQDCVFHHRTSHLDCSIFSLQFVFQRGSTLFRLRSSDRHRYSRSQTPKPSVAKLRHVGDPAAPRFKPHPTNKKEILRHVLRVIIYNNVDQIFSLIPANYAIFYGRTYSPLGSNMEDPQSKRRRGLGVVTANACNECRKKRAKVCHISR